MLITQRRNHKVVERKTEGVLLFRGVSRPLLFNSSSDGRGKAPREVTDRPSDLRFLISGLPPVQFRIGLSGHRHPPLSFDLQHETFNLFHLAMIKAGLFGHRIRRQCGQHPHEALMPIRPRL
jgi:hypothetical protein